MNNILIADLITSECKKKNVKVTSLLQECNINHSFISDIRHKNRAPSVDKISVIADYLDCSVDYLLGRTDNPKCCDKPVNNGIISSNNSYSNSSISISNHKELDEMSANLLKQFNELPFDEKINVFNYIKDRNKEK